MTTRPGALRDDLLAQARYVEPRAPVYARLIELVTSELARGLEARLASAWRGREFGAWYERPLLLLAALREDALREGPCHPLWSAIAVPVPDLAAATAPALRAALAPERAHVWGTLERRFVQTNEPSRAVVWLWPAHLAWRAAPARALSIFDVGASAGLNLIADRVHGAWMHSDGTPLPVAPLPRLTARVGFDLRPLDALRDGDARWLRACVWPGQADREAALRSAIAAFRSARAWPDPPRLERRRAQDVPATLPNEEDGTLALAYQSVMRDYLPPSERAAYEAGMRAWLAQRAPGTALWLELEVTDGAEAGGAPVAITAHVRSPDGLLTLTLATCDAHPRSLDVDDEAVATLARTLERAS